MVIVQLERRRNMENEFKEVRFDLYCNHCAHEKTYSGDDPCDECLATPKNKYSMRPVNFKERE